MLPNRKAQSLFPNNLMKFNKPSNSMFNNNRQTTCHCHPQFTHACLFVRIMDSYKLWIYIMADINISWIYGQVDFILSINNEFIVKLTSYWV